MTNHSSPLHLQIVKRWVKQSTFNKGFNDQMIKQADAVIFTFGSYRLAVNYVKLSTNDLSRTINSLKGSWPRI